MCGKTDRQTDKQTDKQTNRQAQYIIGYIYDHYYGSGTQNCYMIRLSQQKFNLRSSMGFFYSNFSKIEGELDHLNKYIYPIIY